MRYYFLLFFLFLINNWAAAQSITFKGKVTDSLQQPLAYANIIAEPITETEMKFTMTDEKGRFQLKLEPPHSYKILTSFLGYKTQTFTLKARENSYKTIVLAESKEILGEVKINAKLAVNIKEDTTTYQTKHFISGKERKLKEVLKKLPGIEVDRNSNVKVRGKKVSRVLVEGKIFFTGDTKLAVENIPADAVGEVQVLDNYNDITLLKGLEDSDEMVMNIKLKEDKKKFWFGDIKAGGGVKKQYLVHPSLFYYSPKTSINIIGDFNNIGEKSFTFKNYLDFEGGHKKLRLQPKVYFSKMNDDFSKFLKNQDFKSSKHLFAGANINQAIGPESNLIGYVIYSKNKNELKNKVFNQYNSNNSSFLESRTIMNQPSNDFVISKIGFEKELENGGKFKMQSFLKTSDNFNKGITKTTYFNNMNQILTNTTTNNIDIKQNVEWYTEITKNQTIVLLADYNYSKENSLINWKTDRNIFQKLLPITAEDTYSIFKDKKVTSQKISALVKHYWELTNFIHLYTSFGSSVYLDKYFTNEYQKLQKGATKYFNNAKFGNDINFTFINNYITAQLKFQIGRIIMKPEISYHNYHRILMYENEQKNIHKKYVLPALEATFKLKKTEQIKLKYGLKTLFPSVTRLANNYTLTHFNTIYKGNANLENELYHQAYAGYSLFNFYKGIMATVFTNYIKKKKSIKNKNNLTNINSVTESVLINNADESKGINGSITKMIKRYDFSAELGFSKSKYLQFLNNNLEKNKSDNYYMGAGIKTKFSKYPNIEIKYKKILTDYKSVTKSKFEHNDFEVYLDYVVNNNLIFKADYTYHLFKNKLHKTIEKNNLLNVQVSYQKQHSPWFFNVSANNLLNNLFKIKSFNSDFLTSENKTFILPKTIVLSISYKI